MKLRDRFKAAWQGLLTGISDSIHLDLGYGQSKLILVTDKHLSLQQRASCQEAMDHHLASDNKFLMICGAGADARLYVVHNPRPLTSQRQEREECKDKAIGTAYDTGSEIIVAVPHGHDLTTDHNCDAMGCGQWHVLYRFRKDAQ